MDELEELNENSLYNFIMKESHQRNIPLFASQFLPLIRLQSFKNKVII